MKNSRPNATTITAYSTAATVAVRTTSNGRIVTLFMLRALLRPWWHHPESTPGVSPRA